MARKAVQFSNKFFPDVRAKIWHEDEFYKYMQENKLLGIPENELRVLVNLWNRAIEYTLILSLTKEETDDSKD